MADKIKRTELKSVGEFGLIDKIKSRFTLNNKSSITGIGDDAAVIDNGKRYSIISSDMLVEGVHFDLSYFPIKHLGYKAAIVNLSDIAAMNAIPKQITVNIGVSNRFSLEAIEAFYDGIASACEQYNVDLVGGDTTSSQAGFIISITAIGECDKEKIVYRKGAGNGDIICVTGDLGAAYLGLMVLSREKEVFLADPKMQPELEGYDYVVQRLLKPEARMDIIHELRDLALIPTSMIDISDGLASELLHLSKESNLGLNIHGDKLPVDNASLKTAMEFDLDPITAALNGGEDYELLFTIKQEDFPKIEKHPDISFIGYMTKTGDDSNLITASGTVVKLKAQGWDHF